MGDTCSRSSSSSPAEHKQLRTVEDEAMMIASLSKQRDWDEVMKRIDQAPFKDNMENMMKINIFGHTLLHRAAEQGNLHIIERLISIGFDVNCLDKSRHCAIGFACTGGYIDCVKTFVDHDADINIVDIHGHAPLYAAASRGHLDVVKYLVENGADIYQQCVDRQWTAAQWARHWKRDACAEYLEALEANST